MLSGIREILVIVNQTDIEFYKRLLGDGSDFGINIVYEIQKNFGFSTIVYYWKKIFRIRQCLS